MTHTYSHVKWYQYTNGGPTKSIPCNLFIKKLKFNLIKHFPKKKLSNVFYLIFQMRLGCNGMALSHIWINWICPEQSYPFQVDRVLFISDLHFTEYIIIQMSGSWTSSLLIYWCSGLKTCSSLCFSYMLVDNVSRVQSYQIKISLVLDFLLEWPDFQFDRS